MRSSPFAAHGHVIFLVTLDDKEEKIVEINGEDGKYLNGHYYFYEGCGKFTDAETGDQLPDRTAGWLSYDHPKQGLSAQGKVKIVAEGKTSWVCFPKVNNPTGIPEQISCMNTKKGEKFEASVGSNLFLVKGSLEVDGKMFVGPTQIRIRTKDVTLTSKTDSYMIVFP